ncbi:MAG: tetratricopeptide repeat protein [Clostridia bacterium]|nr:tetratricopeptide repeat protein [Oscillospiraceae bacterium]MBQ7033365.1 tetratricopeptide repeat protein [Clostridia bacterium]
MQYLLTVFLPAALIFCTFRLGGVLWGFVTLALYLVIYSFVKLPDLIMIQGAKAYAKNPEKGLARMERALRTKRLRVDYILYYGFVCLKAGKLEDAQRVLDAAAHKKMTPEQSCRSAVNRALLVWKQGDLPQAISILEAQLKMGKDAAVYGTLGQLLILNGQLQRAMEVNQEAYAFDKYDESIVDNLALNYRLSGDLDSSYNLYKELTGKKLGVPVPYYNCGETLYAMGRKEEAVEKMERALCYPFSALAVVSKAEVEARIAEIEAEIEKNS